MIINDNCNYDIHDDDTDSTSNIKYHNSKSDIKNKRNINKISDSDIFILEPSFLW